jgi:hypothetical protein
MQSLNSPSRQGSIRRFGAWIDPLGRAYNHEPMSLLVGRAVVFGLGSLLVLACQRTPQASDRPAPLDSAATASAPAADAAPPAGSPLSRLVPTPQAGPRAACPLSIVPGKSFGPIALGETLEDLKRAGLTVTNVSDTHADVNLPGRADPGSKLGVTLCSGKIIDIWIDDLRTAPACVTYDGKAIAPTIPREELEKLVGGCTDTPPAIGGAHERCSDGGLYVGHGMGNFLQLRVMPKDFPFRNACAIASDDGSLVELSPRERSSILRQTLNLTELARYWHPSTPGRDPLRIVKTPLVAEEPLRMFGSPVVWIDEADAKKGTAFFRVTKLDATKTKATVSFAYPVEGVTGTAVFEHTSLPELWRLESATVAER